MPKGKRKCVVRSVPYARGFKPPTQDKSKAAISYPSSVSLPPLSKPTSIDDWLAQYNEEGQDFQQFVKQNPWLSSRKWRGLTCEFDPSGKTITERYVGTSIYLVPLGNFDDHNQLLAPSFPELMEYVEIFYGLPVKLVDNVKLDFEGSTVYLTKDRDAEEQPTARQRQISRSRQRHHLESRYNKKAQHRQLRVHSILMALRKLVPNDALFVVALTMEDLYEDNADLFVAGMAAGNHRVGVFSFSRYDPTCTFSPEHWYDIKRKVVTCGRKRTENKRKVLQRSCKLLVHELAHLLGVGHCIWYNCCMNGSGHLEEDFRQSMFLCPVDLNKLQLLCGFDVTARYQKMMEYFKKHRLEEERLWVERRLKEIDR